MNKTIKGALGASAAAVLLLGGAGSLAYWTDDATVNGGSVNSGFMTIDPLNIPGTNSACDASWKHVVTGATVVAFVPGDQVTKNCTFTIAAQGDNLSATPTIPGSVTITPTRLADAPAGSPAISTFKATVAAEYSLPGGPLTTGKITQANNGQTLTAKITVTLPYGDKTANNANDTQRINAALSDLTVSLVQDKTTANPNA